MPRADLGGSINTSPTRLAVAGGIALALTGGFQATEAHPTVNHVTTTQAHVTESVSVARTALAAQRSRNTSRSASRLRSHPVSHPVVRHHRAPHRRRHVHHVRHRYSHPHWVVPVSGRAASVISFALHQVGKAYRYGSAGPRAFDCSGLVMAAYRHAGIALPHGTRTLIGHGRPISRGALRPGDIVFLTRSHVAIYLGGNTIVEAANPRAGIRETSLRSFWAGRRVM